MQPEQKNPKIGDFHNAYINPEAYEAYIKSGKFPDKTVLVMDSTKPWIEMLKASSPVATFLESGATIEVAVKNSNRSRTARRQIGPITFLATRAK